MKTITLYNDYDISLCDIAEALDINESEITDSEWQFYFDQQAEDLDYTLEDLDTFGGYAVTADIGRWNGRHTGYAYISTLKDITKYFEDSTKITLDTTTGTLQITTAHHDSTNYITIKPVNSRGLAYREHHYYDNIRLCEKLATTRGLTTKFKI